MKKSSKNKEGAVKSNGPSSSGRITKDKIGYSLPVDRPLYDPFPYLYKDITILTYVYETDREAALELLPAQFELPPGPAMARMIFANFAFSSLGFYNEVAQAIKCTYKGRDFVYPTRFHVTSDRAMAAGREILGIPKKIGQISFHKGAEYLCTLESPNGLRVCSAVLTPKAKLPEKYQKFPSDPTSYASIRVIPDYEIPVPGKPFFPTICQLLESLWVLESGELWSGTGSVHMTGASDLDPYHKLPIINNRQSADNRLPCSLFMGEMSIGSVNLLENL